MTEHNSYWLITKTADGFAIEKVNKKLQVRFNGESAAIILEHTPVEIPVLGLYKDEDEPNYRPDIVGLLKNVEKEYPGSAEKCIAVTCTWIDMQGGRIFCVHSEEFVMELYNSLVIKKAMDKWKTESR